MNILCPSCHSSLPISEHEPIIKCDSCGLETDLSKIGTFAGANPMPMVHDLCGQTIGDYFVEELIGVGGMGVVYKARKNATGPVVALKILNQDYSWKREEFIARFEKEAKTLLKLDHKNIVKYLDSGRDQDIYYLVTEYLEGKDLAKFLREKKPDYIKTIKIMRQVCSAISYAHEQGVIHRDIKPANIIISPAGDIKVLDFGLAQVAGMGSHLTSLTRTDMAMGTFNYLSPEQRTNAKSVDKRSDVFSLGVVFFEMLTGTLPMGNFVAPSRSRPEISRNCDKVVFKSLSADPGDRYQSVNNLFSEIGRLEKGSPMPKPVVGTVIAAVLAVVAGWVLWSQLRTPESQADIPDSQVPKVAKPEAQQKEPDEKPVAQMKGQQDIGSANISNEVIEKPVTKETFAQQEIAAQREQALKEKQLREEEEKRRQAMKLEKRNSKIKSKKATQKYPGKKSKKSPKTIEELTNQAEEKQTKKSPSKSSSSSSKSKKRSKSKSKKGDDDLLNQSFSDSFGKKK